LGALLAVAFERLQVGAQVPELGPGAQHRGGAPPVTGVAEHGQGPFQAPVDGRYVAEVGLRVRQEPLRPGPARRVGHPLAHPAATPGGPPGRARPAAPRPRPARPPPWPASRRAPARRPTAPYGASAGPRPACLAGTSTTSARRRAAVPARHPAAVPHAPGPCA